MTDFVAEFYSFLKDEGFDPAPGTAIIADDRPRRFARIGQKKLNCKYVLFADENFAYGYAVDYFRSHTASFSSRSKRRLTAEEKARIKADMDLRKAARAAADLKAREGAALKAARLYARSTENAPATGYEAKKHIKRYAARVWGNLLVLPVYDGADLENKSRNLVNLQIIDGEGNKRFLSGGQKQGCWCLLGELPERGGELVVCEGYSTGCSIREATGYAVLVAFDAGNLLPVAKKFGKRYNIIFGADNDAARVVNGKFENIGILAAQEAAEAVGGRVCVPPITSGVEHPARSRDFNDLFVEEGAEAVRLVFESPEEPEEQEPVYYEPQEAEEHPFKVLGYDKENYYYLPRAKGKIVALSGPMHTISNLIEIAPLNYWEDKFGDGKNSGKTALNAANALIRASERQGIFDSDDRLRGVGVWKDAGRIVVHAGDRLYVDGVAAHPYEIQSRFVYEYDKTALRFSDKALSAREAVALREICELLSWENPMSGALLAGWCVVAPVCAALQWRPHIWISGESGSGKTTVLDYIIKPVLGASALRVDGGTTEAALRQMLGHAGRPVIYDEAESETRKDTEIMANVLQLVRRASSGATISKWGANGANISTIRSSFCFSAINPALRQRADESRVSMLNLKRRVKSDDDYEKLLERIENTLTPEFSERLLARTVGMLDTLLLNCKAFTKAAALTLGDRRAADQVGTMLAGLYLLSRSDVISVEKARDWIKQHDWTLYTTIGDATDQERLISVIAMHRHRIGPQEVTIGGLIACALGDDDRYHGADNELRTLGIKVEDNRVIFSNTSEQIRRMLLDTPWSQSWKRALGDIPDAVKTAAVYFSPGHTARAVSLPAKYFREAK